MYVGTYVEYKPPEDFDLVLQRVLLSLQRLLVDDLDGHQLAGALATLCQSHFRESAAAIEQPEIRCFSGLMYVYKLHVTHCKNQTTHPPNNLPLIVEGIASPN